MSNSTLPPGAKTAHQRRSTETTHRIVSALIELLKAKHFENVTMAEIAEVADITPGAIYRRFKNKDALVPAILDTYLAILAGWVERSQEAVRAATSFNQGLESLIYETQETFVREAHILRVAHLFGRLDRTQARGEFAIAHETLEITALSSLCERFGLAPDRDSLSLAAYTILTGALERCLYPEFAPAILLRANNRQFAHQQCEMISAWLRQDS